MLILDRQVDSFKQDRVVTVVLVDVLGDLHLLVDALYLAIDCGEQLLITDGRWEKPDDLQYLYLEPGARRHVVEVILRVLLHVCKNRDKLGQ